MNELIKKLTKQSGMNFTPAQFSGVLEDEVDEFKMQKFAELIVKECMQQATKDKEEYVVEGYNDVWNNALDHVANNIKEHFGVE